MTNSYSKPHHILIVDDNDDDIEAITRAFRKAGLNNPISMCRSGQDALDFLRGKDLYKDTLPHKPSLILLDLNMPGLDGRQVLQLIKEDPGLRRIPVVVWTTSSSEKDIFDCYQAGANAYMQKPPTLEGIISAVTRLKQYWFETALLTAEE